MRSIKGVAISFAGTTHNETYWSESKQKWKRILNIWRGGGGDFVRDRRGGWRKPPLSSSRLRLRWWEQQPAPRKNRETRNKRKHTERGNRVSTFVVEPKRSPFCGDCGNACASFHPPPTLAEGPTSSSFFKSESEVSWLVLVTSTGERIIFKRRTTKSFGWFWSRQRLDGGGEIQVQTYSTGFLCFPSPHSNMIHSQAFQRESSAISCWSQNGVEHVQRFDETVLSRTPLTQLLKCDKAILVDIDFL